MTDDELIAVARAAAAARGRDALDDARITRRGAEAAVLLSDPAYARGGRALWGRMMCRSTRWYLSKAVFPASNCQELWMCDGSAVPGRVRC
jgi:hypothetical protein